jgi:P2 family phage contractile tail tube protein
MTVRNIVGDFEMFRGGNGFAGQFEEIGLPDLKMKGEDYIGGGGLGTRHIGSKLDKMEISGKSNSWERELFSDALPVPGSTSSWKVLGSLIVPGEDEKSLKVTWQGALMELKRGHLKASGKADTEFKWMDIIYYQEVWDGVVAWEIDLLNYKMIGPDGVDRMAVRRRNLGR